MPSNWTKDCARGTKRLYFSDKCQTIYLLIILVNVGLIFWTLSLPGGYDGGIIFVMAQLFINAVLVCEVAIRYIGAPESFWDECSNVFDVFVMILGIATQLLYIADPNDYGAEEEAALAIRLLRDGFQFLRLGVFLKNRRLSRPYHMVDFNSKDLHEYVPVRFQDDPLLQEQCAEVSDDSSGSSDY
mmetsp:Transcript_3091/g.7213  ORF Transcript_3091/g.7213 Transcript_3091/m.7213 type:complete len:186 (-) Transcript_3091:204-761(-)|eukprot:CAMPEP_0114523138 /NCGR_PEP_ID=MMETSP0109-20121206/21128_1 /TAXON_ID=29199 /ORGANISM="Chlorarachnion reptans, Strain CCCM449" /LENGTH=185 /DNA_ID=CAMNT_0001704427 /DNA_START=46 /DNA_END=603 /DNA_ORIENTATION=+